MHNSGYVDRGIIKWAPFDALVGYSTMLKELKHRLGKKARPVLSEDQLEALDRKLRIAIAENTELDIDYFDDGYIKQTFGTIKTIDWVHRIIILTSLERLKADDIVEIYLP
jgi:hypothetical protein